MQEADMRASVAGTPSPELTQRRPELQDWLNSRLYHPLAHKLARLLARTRVTPNQVSIAGGLFVVAAALAYTRLSWPGAVLAGLLLHMTWHVVDGADGDLARMTGRSSPTGETVDGLCDYASHAVLYGFLGQMLTEAVGPIGWLAMLAAALSRIVQTNHFEVQRRLYQWRVYGTDWVGTDRPEGSGALLALLRVYIGLARLIAPEASRLDALLHAASDDERQRNRVRLMAREELAGPLGRLAPLGSNQRTLALGLSMLAGSPLWYFLYEATLLNLILVLSIRRHRRATRRLESRIAGLEASTRR